MHSLCDVCDLDNIRSSWVTATMSRSTLVFRMVAMRPEMAIAIAVPNEQHPREASGNRGVHFAHQPAKDVSHLDITLDLTHLAQTHLLITLQIQSDHEEAEHFAPLSLCRKENSTA